MFNTSHPHVFAAKPVFVAKPPIAHVGHTTKTPRTEAGCRAQALPDWRGFSYNTTLRTLNQLEMHQCRLIDYESV